MVSRPMAIAFNTSHYMRNFAPGRNPNWRKAGLTRKNQPQRTGRQNRQLQSRAESQRTRRSNSTLSADADHRSSHESELIQLIFHLSIGEDGLDLIAIRGGWDAPRASSTTGDSEAAQMRVAVGQIWCIDHPIAGGNPPWARAQFNAAILSPARMWLQRKRFASVSSSP